MHKTAAYTLCQPNCSHRNAPQVRPCQATREGRAGRRHRARLKTRRMWAFRTRKDSNASQLMVASTSFACVTFVDPRALKAAEY